ncbi:MAG: hypothetical protein QM582_18265, partial [Micropruina sp.]|uniref:hypothetical protein n=1 Tax=Micropruina sp. TaxID=2737536 RepID=UPI0039E645CD
LVALAGCTGELPPAPTPAAPAATATLPADVFPALPDRGAGIVADVEAMVGDDETLLLVGTAHGREPVPVLRYSTDAGATWHDGELSPAASSATVIGEETVGVAAVAAAGQQRRWLALGSADRALFAWTSADARTWERAPVTGIDPGRGEEVSSVAGMTGGGFVAVGGRQTEAGSRPMAWTSPDGIAWTARKIGGEGWLREVATSGDRMVAVGERSFGEVTKKGRSQESLLLSSTDRGVTWRRSAVREPVGSGNFVSRLGEVVATDTGFMVGGTYYHDRQDTYRPMLLTSGDLRTWKQTPRLLDAGDRAEIAELMQLRSTTVAVQRVARSQTRTEVKISYLYPGASGWMAADTPGTDASAWAAVGAVSGETTVLAVELDGNPSKRRLWRHTGQRLVGDAEVATPADLRPDVRPVQLLVVDGRLGASGTAQGTPAIWAADGAGFGVPKALPVAADQSVDQVAWHPDGGYLAIGQQVANHALTLHSPDAAHWQRTAPKTFNKVAQYHGSTIEDVAWVNGRWVAVGTKTSNGDVRQSALVYTSTDGRSWLQGRPTEVTGRGDWYDRRDPLDDLHGLDNRSREMRAVTGYGRGAVAVGLTTSDGYQRPAAWTSSDLRRWRLVTLPSGKYPEAYLTSVDAVGTVLVARGWALAKGATDWESAVWRSTDGGRSWTFGGGHSVAAAVLAAGGREFLRVELADDRRTLTLFRSPDGRSWTSSQVPVAGLADGMRLSLRDAVVHDGAVQLLLTLRTARDAVTVLQRIPL